jgi:hypothetical protein
MGRSEQFMTAPIRRAWRALARSRDREVGSDDESSNPA